MRLFSNKDRGASLIESALASLVLISLLLGILEFSLFFRTYLTVKDAVDIAATEAASYGSRFDSEGNITADAVAATAIRNSTGLFPPENIEKIIVWKAINNKKPPQICIDSQTYINTPDVQCNVYGPDAIAAVQNGDMNYFLCSTFPNGTIDLSSNAYACGFPSSERRDEIGQSDIDYVGVYLQVRHNFATAFFTDGITISSYSVKRLEVRRSESQTVSQ